MSVQTSSKTAPRASFFASSNDWDATLCQLRSVIEQELRPNIAAIDLEGHYPTRFMRILGEGGGFEQSAPIQLGGGGRGLKATIQVMEAVSNECMSTGFCLWCQTVCGWYIQNGDSQFLKTEILPDVLSGARMAGTGLSNPMKHLAGIEKINLIARPTDGGFTVNGVLPWVSNVHDTGVFAAVAQIENTENYLMAIFPGDADGLTLGDGGHFVALEGSSTKSARFRDVFVPNEWILASPIPEYIARIRPGFILTQTGFGLGLIESCLDLMKRANHRTGHVNCFLDDGVDEIEADWCALQNRVYAIADEIGTGETAPSRDLTAAAIQARIDTSELALRASQAAILHAGAAGYRSGGAVERKLRESYFVAIVTPALKHLKKLQHDMAAKSMTQQEIANAA